jgi:hypothetical protein
MSSRLPKRKNGSNTIRTVSRRECIHADVVGSPLSGKAFAQIGYSTLGRVIEHLEDEINVHFHLLKQT